MALPKGQRHRGQTLIPLAAPGMIGQQGQATNLCADGEVKLPDYSRLQLTLAKVPGQSVGMIHDGSRMFVLKNDQPQPTQADPTAEVLPATDYALYAEAADDIHPIDPQTINGQLFTRYAFTINGPRLAQAVVKRMNQNQVANAQIQSSPALMQLTGRGELWVDQNGLPIKQILDLDLPQAGAQYASHMHMVAMFSDFGSITSIQRPVQSPDGSWHLESQLSQSGSAATPIVAQALPSIGSILLIVAGSIAIGLMYVQRRRRVTAIISVSLALSIVFTPAIQLVQVANAAAQPSLQKNLNDLLQAPSPKPSTPAPQSTSQPVSPLPLIFKRPFNAQAAALHAANRPACRAADPSAAMACRASTAITTA